VCSSRMAEPVAGNGAPQQRGVVRQTSAFRYGGAGSVPIAGDWDGDLANWRRCFIRTESPWRTMATNENLANDGPPEIAFATADPAHTDQRDWNGDVNRDWSLHPGRSRRWRTMATTNLANDGPPEIAFRYGGPGSVPITGDW